ncbi:L-rhamnose-H+ transport protein [Bryocella elongata]|uniref:L-rhamnose-H+ transport protein n=1 Tax=Bryocella elongata TaxID=863522 RepID=A0A1H5UAH6_9BACT|nr:L-rhamnose/proton symporter RhaT [Bryocella elongata]SEF72102.1 L-rhamnose-H+ transport protein [Bryocella elongata]
MNPNPFLGVIFHWIGGFASATNFIPFRGIKRWSWEVYWIIQGIAAWLIAPTVLALIFVPHPFAILKAAHELSPGNIWWPMFWGLLWGVGGLTFGLAIRYLGLGLGYAIALGFCTAFGTVIPPLWHGMMGPIVHSTSGRITLAGVGLSLVAIAVSGAAGASKEREITPEEKAETGERDYSFAKGLVIAIFAGIMSSFFAIGLDAGKPIGDMTLAVLKTSGRATLYSNLPILIVVLWGGFITNFVWSLILLAKNHSFAQFTGTPGDNPMGTAAVTGETLVDFDPRDYIGHINGRVLILNYLFAASAGVIWYFQFFFYSMGQTKMGKYDFASWTLHMASIIIFANLWGLALKEWKGTSFRTRALVFSGLLLLIGSTIVVGYGSYLAAQPK